MWDALGKLFAGGEMQVITFIGGMVLLIAGISRKWKIVPDQRKWLNRVGLMLLLVSMALWAFSEVMPHVQG